MKKNCILLFLWLLLLTGVVYPLVITLIAQVAMPFKANGSIISINNGKIGSVLISQKFESDRYFWPRPSASDYSALPSSGSNLGPTSRVLQNLVKNRRAHLIATHGKGSASSIPSELLFASGSGLDPHLSPEAVDFQLERVAKARKYDEAKTQHLRTLIISLIQKRQLGFLGSAYINVLQLNLALDAKDATP